MLFKNIKSKLLFWYSITIIFVLAIFSYLILDEFTELILAKEAHIHTSINHLESLLAFWIPILVIVSIIIGYFIIKNALLPVKKTIDEVKNIEINRVEDRLTSHTKGDEIDELVSTFNLMLDKLDESVSKIKRFSYDVSHELKTPLTIIRGEVELGLRKDRDNNEYKEILKSTLEETISLQEVVDSLLFLSKVNDKEIKRLFEMVDIKELVLNIISSNQQLIKAKNLKLPTDKIGEAEFFGHNILLKILITNIIQNAIKYSHKNSTVDIELQDDTLIIKDYGMGIKKSDINNIFDRFYRVDKARNKDKSTQGGYGLGLAIAKNIAIMHNIFIDVDSKYQEYTKFTLKFRQSHKKEK
jgi:signal transduction histidine kinase